MVVFSLIRDHRRKSAVKVFRFHGKKDLLDALHRPQPDHGRGPASLVGPGAYLASAGALLVGGVQERMVSVEGSRPSRGGAGIYACGKAAA